MKITDKYATVGDLIGHLKTFDPSQRLCFWDEGGANIECVHVPEGWFKGGQMFQTVRDRKLDQRKRFGSSDSELEQDYRFVDDNDVIIY